MVKKKAGGGGDKHNGFPSLKFSKSYLAVKNFLTLIWFSMFVEKILKTILS